nr:unnamed protein product [Callosobruchus chinensis]
MFRPDFPKFLNEAVKSRRVTPAIIALAAYESKGLWREAVEIYADALSEDPHSDAIEAATYYIACHKVYEAIDLLVSRNMFKEALALAKCRSNPGSPMVAKVIEAWAKYAFENGNFERAAEW